MRRGECTGSKQREAEGKRESRTPPCMQEAPGSLPAPIQLRDQVSTRSRHALIPVCRWGFLPGPTPGKQDSPPQCLCPRDVCRVEAMRGAWQDWGHRLGCGGTVVGHQRGQQWDCRKSGSGNSSGARSSRSNGTSNSVSSGASSGGGQGCATGSQGEDGLGADGTCSVCERAFLLFMLSGGNASQAFWMVL